MATEEQYCGTLLGCAVGDALGMPVEGFKRTQIQKYVGRVREFMDPVLVRDGQGNLVREDEFGKFGYYTLDFKKGEYTDDTILTLALAESIIASKGLNLEDVAQRQLAEYLSRKQPNGEIHGGFGGTTRDGFKNLLKGMKPTESGVTGGPGNAPAMKMSPVGMYMDATGKYEEGLNFAAAVGKITHLDPRSIASGVVQAHAVYAMLQKMPRNDFLDSMVEVCARYEQQTTPKHALWDKGNLQERLQWVREHSDVTPNIAHQHLRSSSVVYSSHPFALFMMQKYWDDPLPGLIETVNYGGDCDTTGAIFGALAGARHGCFIPSGWLKQLQNRDGLEQAAKGLYTLREGAI